MGRSSTWELNNAGRPKRRWRRLLLGLVLLLVLSPGVLAVVAETYFRHVPYAIDPEDALGPQQAQADQGLWIRWLGISGYEISDGTTTILLDPTLTRPRPSELLLPLASDPKVVDPWIARADYILVNHSHHDHALDVPAIATRTGAQVYGSTSTCNLAQSRGVPAAQTHPIAPGERVTLGTFTVTAAKAVHVPILGMDPPFAGEVSPSAGKLWFWQFGLDETLSFHLRSENGTSVWFHPTIKFEEGDLGGLTADVLIYGINGEPLKSVRTRAIVQESQAQLVLPTHYDNFMQPLNAGLALFPGVDPATFRRHLKSYNREFDADVRWAVLDYGQRVHVAPAKP
ncbi:MAG: MBL fold metallo-hydrolase [Planctomycetota bacterium]